jgi:hypothetical protein
MPPKLPHPATLPRQARLPAATAQARVSHAATRPRLKPPHPAPVVQRRAPHPALARATSAPCASPRTAPNRAFPGADPSRVVQRMDGPPAPPIPSTNAPPPKNAWRHLELALQSRRWVGFNNVRPWIQIAIARNIVSLLREHGIRARLGGSVAALGYSTTRLPEDIDIDIWPQGAHLDAGKRELAQAKDLVYAHLVGKTYQFQMRLGTLHYRIKAFTSKKESAFLIQIEIQGVVIAPPHGSFMGDEASLPIDLQLINETAFTLMNKSLDPGQVSVEKYKEVAGLSRLVANCIGRYLQNYPRDPKEDRARAAQMLKAKLSLASPSKVVIACAKILDYFGTETKDARAADDQGQVLAILAEIVGEFRADFAPSDLVREVRRVRLERVQQLTQLLQQLDPEFLKLLGFANQ